VTALDLALALVLAAVVGFLVVLALLVLLDWLFPERDKWD
jgi:hypothetical protein